MKKITLIALLGLLAFVGAVSAQDNLAGNFVRPPDSARPWVYWFWLNGNITREGITADLEAMRRAGIGGVLIMEVDQGAPRGPVDFVGPRWRELFKHAVAEAGRLGLEINMNDDAGWNGSGGPWITPELSMQKVVWTETTVHGPKRFDEAFAQPAAVAGYYGDIVVWAFPKPKGGAWLSGFREKAGYVPYDVTPATHASWPEPPADETISRSRLVDLTARLDKNGRLTWDVPAGTWTI
ncbi:MAG: glycosyl hydrolase, partial [Candidatus Aminicenantales bacterium]